MMDRLGLEADEDLLEWIRAYELQLRDHSDDLVLMAPWLTLPMWIMEHPIQEKFLAQDSTEQVGSKSELQAELLRLDGIPLLREVSEIARKLMPIIDQISSYFQGVDRQTEKMWLQELGQKIMDAEKRAGERLASIDRLALDCSELADIKYDFLFNESRRLLAIGYNVDDSKRDESCYDLLASEARLCSYVAIAQGRLKQEHWFALGRMLTTARRRAGFALLGWDYVRVSHATIDYADL